MSKHLLPYYEKELVAIRQLAAEFGKNYTATAGKLQLEATRSVDPHVERLLEGFAFLAGRVHHKLDDEFPELTDALLQVLYPHYLAPIPSMLTVEFKGAPERTPLNDGFTIERHTQLLTPVVNEVRCRYRTAYPVTVWPVAITSARLQGPPWQGLRLPASLQIPNGTAAVLQIQLECQAGATFANIALDALRFHLIGENATVAELYELMLNQATQVLMVPTDVPSAPRVEMAPADAISPVGFNLDEGLLPYPPQSFPGYRLLTEFFSYPAKFWYVDVRGFRQAARNGFGKRMDLLVFLRRSKPNVEKAVETSTFRTGCTPAVNLFSHAIQPIPLTQARYEYRVVPADTHTGGFEVHSVESVTGVDPENDELVEYRPFYAINHTTGRGGREAFWHAERKPSVAKDDPGTEVFLNLVDRGWDPILPATSTLDVRAICTNRQMATTLQRAGDQLNLELEKAAPLASIICVRSPSLPLRPPRREHGYWRLLSHLALNHLSITDPEHGTHALQEILRLYNFAEESGEQLAEVNAMLIDGVSRVSSRRVVGRVGDGAAAGFARGVEVTLELDEDKFVGTGAFLFASVIERFLGLYASVNSFTQLVAKTRQGDRVIRKWPPRAGDVAII